MNKSTLIKQLKAIANNKYTTYQIDTDLDDCNRGNYYVNVNVWIGKELIDSVEVASFEYDEDVFIADVKMYAKAKKAENKYIAMLPELNELFDNSYKFN